MIPRVLQLVIIGAVTGAAVLEEIRALLRERRRPDVGTNGKEL